MTLVLKTDVTGSASGFSAIFTKLYAGTDLKGIILAEWAKGTCSMVSSGVD